MKEETWCEIRLRGDSKKAAVNAIRSLARRIQDGELEGKLLGPDYYYAFKVTDEPPPLKTDAIIDGIDIAADTGAKGGE